MIPSKAVISEGRADQVILALDGNVFKGHKIDVGPESDGADPEYCCPGLTQGGARRSSPMVPSS
jgi:hypothetical protein